MILETKLPVRYILGIVRYELIIVLLVGITTYFTAITLTAFLPDMPLTIPAFLGTSISVLLSFKMNQSYDRWWEARKIWGSITNDVRSLVMQLQSFTAADQVPAVKKISYRLIAWSHALGRSLRGKLVPVDDAAHLLGTAELAQISKQPHQPLALLQLITADIKTLRLHHSIDVHTQIHLQETVIRLTDSMGGAERIAGTVFPSSYRFVLHFIIYLFVVTLAISLKDNHNIFVIPLLLLISGGFFCIEKIAYHLQDPFRNLISDVPVTDIARNIEINIRQLLGEEAPPAPPATNDYFVM